MCEIITYLTYEELRHDRAEMIAAILRETADEVSVDIMIGVDFQQTTEVVARYSNKVKAKKAKGDINAKFRNVKNVW